MRSQDPARGDADVMMIASWSRKPPVLGEVRLGGRVGHVLALGRLRFSEDALESLIEENGRGVAAAPALGIGEVIQPAGGVGGQSQCYAGRSTHTVNYNMGGSRNELRRTQAISSYHAYRCGGIVNSHDGSDGRVSMPHDMPPGSECHKAGAVGARGVGDDCDGALVNHPVARGEPEARRRRLACRRGAPGEPWHGAVPRLCGRAARHPRAR